MPVLDLHIKEVDTQIIDPITTQLVWAILDNLNISKQLGPQSVFINSDRRAPSGTTISDNTITSINRCDVTIRPITNPANIKWADGVKPSNSPSSMNSRLYSHELYPLFNDAAANVRIVEQLIPMTLALEFSIKLKQIELARLVESSIINSYTKEARYNIHTFDYSYPVDSQTLFALYQIYKLKRSYYPAINFIQYIKEHLLQELAFHTSKVADQSQLVIKRKSLRVYGLLEYNQDAPEPIKIEQLTDRWDIKFTYNVQMEYPNTLRMYFPCVVENQLVDQSIIVRSQDKFNYLELGGILQTMSFNNFLKFHPLKLEQHTTPVTIPYYNDFTIPTTTPAGQSSFTPLLISGFLLDPGITEINLAELGDVNIHSTVLDIIKEHGDDIFTNLGIFNIAIFANEVLIDPSRLSITNNVLTISANDDNKRYHFVLSEATSLNHMHGKYIRLIMKYRWMFPITIARHIKKLADIGYLTISNGNAWLSTLNATLYDGKLDTYIAKCIEDGHADNSLYQYATTSFQFAEYIAHTRSLKSPKHLHDIFVEMYIENNLIKPAYLPLPIGKEHGSPSILFPPGVANNGINTPLRVANATISTGGKS